MTCPGRSPSASMIFRRLHRRRRRRERGEKRRLGVLVVHHVTPEHCPTFELLERVGFPAGKVPEFGVLLDAYAEHVTDVGFLRRLSGLRLGGDFRPLPDTIEVPYARVDELLIFVTHGFGRRRCGVTLALGDGPRHEHVDEVAELSAHELLAVPKSREAPNRHARKLVPIDVALGRLDYSSARSPFFSRPGTVPGGARRPRPQGDGGPPPP